MNFINVSIFHPIRKYFDEDSLPGRLVHREEKIREITRPLEPVRNDKSVRNLFIHGPLVTGETSVCKWMLKGVSHGIPPTLLEIVIKKGPRYKEQSEREGRVPEVQAQFAPERAHVDKCD